MRYPILPRETAPAETKDHNVRELPIAVIVVLCIFTPFFLSFIGCLVYRKFKQHQEKKGLGDEDKAERQQQEDQHVEMQTRGFLDQGLSGNNKRGGCV
jgi:hypothetical protein